MLIKERWAVIHSSRRYGSYFVNSCGFDLLKVSLAKSAVHLVWIRIYLCFTTLTFHFLNVYHRLCFSADDAPCEFSLPLSPTDCDLQPKTRAGDQTHYYRGEHCALCSSLCGTVPNKCHESKDH